MPIKIIIEEDEEEVIEKSIAELFEERISDDDSAIIIKWNVPTLVADEVLPKILLDFPRSAILKYLKFCNVKIKFSSIGFHLLGENKIPHVHFHIICESIGPPPNPSQHRSRWFEKSGASEQFRFLTFKYHKKLTKDTAKYSTLAYPLKEGKSLRLTFPELFINISDNEFQFLEDVGTSIYNKECGIHLRTAKCNERKKNALLELNMLIRNNENYFYDYRSMLLWLDVNYISTLNLEQLPDPRHYKSNLQKIAVKLGYILYSDLC